VRRESEYQTVGYLLTKNIFRPFSNLRRMIRKDMRPTYDHYRDGIALHHRSKDWSDEVRTSWILASLRRTIRTAALTRYYSDVFKKVGFDPMSEFGFEDFARLPILEREDIATNADAMISPDVPIDQRRPDSSGGSTGEPTQIWTGPEERGWAESTMESSFRKVGISPGSRVAFFWGHHLDPGASDSLADRVRYFAKNEKYFDCFRLTPEVIERFHSGLEDYSPDCLVAYSSSLAHFSEVLEARGISPKNYPRKCIVTGAEKLYSHHREAIEKLFRVPVYERYGGRDFGLLAIQVSSEPSDRVFEVDWTWALVEPETEGDRSSILVTKFHADAMPMIRYRVGDIGTFPSGSRPGHPSLVLKEIVGRELDFIWLPDGEALSGAQLPHLFRTFPVREFMFVQEENFSVELQIVPRPELSQVKRDEIEKIVSLNLRGIPLSIRLVDSIERTRANKWRPVVSKVRR
jgi:phenylacetate-CoA ligase